MLFLELIVGAAMAVIFMFLGHTLGEEKADREIITKFNSLRGQLRKEIYEELESEERGNTSSFKYDVGARLDEVQRLLYTMQSRIDEYEYVSMSMFNQLTGRSSTQHDVDLGWIDLEGSQIYNTERGYVLELPKPINFNLKGENQ